MACRGESNSMFEGMMASAPYTRKKGVNPVDWFSVVLRLHNTAGSSSIHATGALSKGATSLGLIPDKMRPFPALLDRLTGDGLPMPHRAECRTAMRTELAHPLQSLFRCL